MDPLDAGQMRELEFLRSQRSPWVRWSPIRRTAAAVLIASITAGLAAVLAFTAGGAWPWVGLGSGLLILLLLMPNIVAPDRALIRAVRMTVPTAESMKHGDQNRNWPG